MVPEEVIERAAVDDVSPRYLRKQKPADATRRRLRQASSTIRRGALAFFIAVAAAAIIGGGTYFLFYSPVMLLHPDQIEISGARYVTSNEVASIFAADEGRSVLRLPLRKRLNAIERIPWVRSAAVERILPNRLNVMIVERQPVAFLSTNLGMKLIDADGVILDKPQGARFNLPVIAGLEESMPPAERVRRLQMFAGFLKEIQTVSPSADSEVSEANLANPDDVQATLAGVPVLSGQGPVVVHFGDSNFAGRFRAFLSNFPTWEAKTGSVEAVDLRYDGEALVTPEVAFSMNNSTGAQGADAAANAPTPPLSALAEQHTAQQSSFSKSRRNRKGRVRQ